ncbi:hypothetical protein BaRGS_00020285 [Batillaria attramentaria]|uniref:Phytochrome n=1 Tax=Batillaria attramentaria TaxID=370345 RepID=A0ABD0KNX7_9CAEN
MWPLTGREIDKSGEESSRQILTVHSHPSAFHKSVLPHHIAPVAAGLAVVAANDVVIHLTDYGHQAAGEGERRSVLSRMMGRHPHPSNLVIGCRHTARAPSDAMRAQYLLAGDIHIFACASLMCIITPPPTPHPPRPQLT